MPASVWILTLAQALSMSVAPLLVFSGGIVGRELAPSAALATLPVACMVIGTALGVLPATRMMQRRGRKIVFVVGALKAVFAALLAAWGIYVGSFVLFCCAAILIGISVAIAQQYRFAAMEVVDVSRTGRAASQVLLGGLVAAFLGPELVVYGAAVAGWLGLARPEAQLSAFLGAFVLLAVVCVGALAVIGLGYRNHNAKLSSEQAEGRPLREIMHNRLVWLAVGAAAMGYAMMSFMMTATPLDMHTVMGYSLAETKGVIQSHIISMFLPSLFSGWLIATLGHRGLIGLGVAVYTICLAVAMSGQQLHHYWWALVLLGIGWNFLFVGGTALLPLCYRPEEAFKVQSVNEFTVFGSQAVTALSSGWVISQFGWHGLLSMAATMVIVVVVMLWLNRGAMPSSEVAHN